MEHDPEAGPETNRKSQRLSVREQKLFAYLLRLTVLVCILVLAQWIL